ncbi:hypothetical protein BMS3Bbin10_01302 [bacterium BMS3Bbin10]|nr:hypothetical protein BMS3Bbin10_01302 [bacterium BMS3Bbin10]
MTLLELSEFARNVGIVLAGGIGIWLAWLRVTVANKQAELARRDHVAELFTRAVGQLADSKLEVRLGAIYTLRQIANDFPDLTSAVFELLSAYLRENAVDYGEDQPPIDVREIMAILKQGLGG